MNTYLRALLRFWWLPVLGLAIAAVAAISVTHKIGLSVPPKLTPRSTPTYTATTNLLVDANNRPFLRTTVTKKEPSTQSIQIYNYRDSAGKLHTARIPVMQPGRTITQAPDPKPLIAFANLAPQYIESDPVTALRIRKFPQLGADPGSVTARAIGSVIGNNKFKTSPIPAIQITATADTPRGAINLAQATVQAFQDWLTRQEKAIPQAQRIVVNQLQVPYKATASSSSSKSLSAVVFLVVLGAFALLAGMLDRAFPRRRGDLLTEAKLDRLEDELDGLTDDRAPFAFARRARGIGTGDDAAR